MPNLRMLAICGMLGSVLTLAAQDIASGPEKASAVPALQVYDATGPEKGKEVDYAKLRQEKTTLYVFIQADKWDRPMARFLRKLDESLPEKDQAGQVVAVWLTENVDKTKEYLPRAQESLKLQAAALTCFPGEPAGPKDWHINADAHLTVVAAQKGKVVGTLGYRSINETAVPEVLNLLKK